MAFPCSIAFTEIEFMYIPARSADFAGTGTDFREVSIYNLPN